MCLSPDDANRKEDIDHGPDGRKDHGRQLEGVVADDGGGEEVHIVVDVIGVVAAAADVDVVVVVVTEVQAQSKV